MEEGVVIMERLTKRVDRIAVLESWAIDKDPVSIIQRLCNRLAAYEDTGLEPEEIKELRELCTDEVAELARTLHKAMESGEVDHLRDLLKSEQDGRLVVLPCKVGDTVYFTLLGRIIEKPVFSIVSFSASARIYCAGTSEYFRPEDFGKTVFLTREEAEAALAQEGEHDG